MPAIWREESWKLNFYGTIVFHHDTELKEVMRNVTVALLLIYVFCQYCNYPEFNCKCRCTSTHSRIFLSCWLWAPWTWKELCVSDFFFFPILQYLCIFLAAPCPTSYCSYSIIFLFTNDLVSDTNKRMQQALCCGTVRNKALWVTCMFIKKLSNMNTIWYYNSVVIDTLVLPKELQDCWGHFGSLLHKLFPTHITCRLKCFSWKYLSKF